MLILISILILNMAFHLMYVETFHYQIGRNVIIFGADMSSSADDATLTAEAKYSINFTKQEKKNYLSLHGKGSNS